MTIETRQRIKCIAADYVAVVLALLVFNICRYEWFIERESMASLADFLTSRTIVTGMLVFPLMMTGIYYLSGAYYDVMRYSRLDMLTKTIITNAIGAIIIYFVILIDDIVDDKATFYEMLGSLWAILTFFTASERLYIAASLIRKIRYKRYGYNTLIVGVTQSAINMVNKLNNAPKVIGINILGYVNPTDDPPTADDMQLPVYPIADIDRVMRENNVVNLIVMPHRDGIHATMELINSLFPYGKSILISPVLMHMISGKSSFGNVSGEPLIDVSHPTISPSTASCKRAADIFFSALALLVLSPLYITVALLIKIKSPGGSIFYRQERVGFRKKKFNIIKFRTMRPHAEENGPALASTDDPRITPIGRFLRKYRIDELPQFWNVLKGDMSIVGPRPEREYYVSRIVQQVPYYTLIHNVRPGITSWGMVKYGYATTVEEMIERLQYDLVYIENISFGVDMKIILYTVKTVLTGKGV